MSESTASVAVFNPVPASDAPVPQTPLHHTARAVGAGKAHFRELDLTGLLILRGDASDAAFGEAVQQVFGCALPERLGFTSAGDNSVLWMSPDEWWILCPHDQVYDLEVKFRAQYNGHCSVANNTGGNTLIQLGGPEAVNVLRKSMPYDFSDSHFPVGKVITSVFAKTQAVVRRLGEEEWQIIARRSFADYIWRWLEDASREYR